MVDPPVFFGVCLFGVVLWVVLLFGGFFWFVLVLFCYCFATEWLLFCLRGWWGWFSGVFWFALGVWRCFHGLWVMNVGLLLGLEPLPEGYRARKHALCYVNSGVSLACFVYFLV